MQVNAELHTTKKNRAEEPKMKTQQTTLSCITPFFFSNKNESLLVCGCLPLTSTFKQKGGGCMFLGWVLVDKSMICRCCVGGV